MVLNSEYSQGSWGFVDKGQNERVQWIEITKRRLQVREIHAKLT